MKHLLTAIACCLAVAGSAQTPYNPDSDSDNLIGTVDLMSLLPLYGNEFYPEVSELVIDTLSWLGHELDTLDFPIDADVVILDYGSLFEADDCGGYEPFNNQCRLRFFRMPENDITWHHWHVIKVAPTSEDIWSINYRLITDTPQGYLTSNASYSMGNTFNQIKVLLEPNVYMWN